MEEDIEILEDMLNKESSIYKRNRRGNKEIKFEVNSNYYNAIENILTSYKQLEEERNTYRRQLNNAFDRGFIHKDKVKEKIKEINKSKMYIVTSPVHNRDEKLEILTRNRIKKEILEELLGEE